MYFLKNGAAQKGFFFVFLEGYFQKWHGWPYMFLYFFPRSSDLSKKERECKRRLQVGDHRENCKKKILHLISSHVPPKR